MDKLAFAGIEISAEVLLVRTAALDGSTVHREFRNDRSGHQAICRHLRRAGATVRVCMESTGLYGLDLAMALAESPGIEVMVANPRAVRRFAQACMKRNKTDRLDVEVLYQFAARMEFRPWRPPSAKALQLRALGRRIGSLVDQLAGEKNRHHAAHLSKTTPAAVLRSIAQEMRFLEREITELRQAALELIHGDPSLAQRFQLLCSIKGVGVISALAILSELAILPPDLDVRQWVGFAGLDPLHHTSGTSVHRRKGISRSGNKQLRRALYFPALVAAVHQPHVKAFYQHLVDRKKAKLQALVAVMRKLLHAIYGMFKHEQPFDGTKFYQPRTRTGRKTLVSARVAP